MAVRSTSGKKAHRASLRRRVYNLRRKATMKTTMKEVTKALGTGDTKTAVKALPSLYQAIDKAAKRGLIKKNTAARMKSRFAKKLK